MKNLKTLLALALSLSMCVSLAACGSSADDDDEDKAEKKTPTSSAAAAEKESDEKTESKAEAEESTAESTADESEATESETDTDSSESSLTLDYFEAIAKEIANVSTIEEAEKIVTEKLPVDVSSKEVSEFTQDKDGFDSYFAVYKLQQPINAFGNVAEIDDPMPPVDAVTIRASTKGSKPDSISFSMTETPEKESEYYENNDLYSERGFSRSSLIKIKLCNELGDRYGEEYESDVYDVYYWMPDGLPFTVSLHEQNADYKTGSYHSIDFDYDPDYIEK